MKTLGLLLAVLCLLLFTFGSEKVRSYLSGGRILARSQLERSSPVPLEAARIRGLIERETARVNEFEDQLIDVESRYAVAQTTLRQLQQKMDTERQGLAALKGMLDQGKRRYVVGGVEYTKEELAAEALSRVEACQNMAAEQNRQSGIVKNLAKSLEVGHAALGEARRRLAELTAKLEELRVRNDNAELRATVTKLASAIEQAAPALSGELESSVRNLENRVIGKERRADGTLAEAGRKRIEIHAGPPEDASTVIGNFLRQSSDTSVTTSSASALPFLVPSDKAPGATE